MPPKNTKRKLPSRSKQKKKIAKNSQIQTDDTQSMTGLDSQHQQILPLIAQLPIRTFEVPTLKPQGYTQAQEKILDLKKTIKKDSILSLALTLEISAHTIQQLKGFYDQHPELKTLDFDKQIKFLKSLSSHLDKLNAVLEDVDIKHALNNKADLIFKIKKHIAHFYGALYPQLIDLSNAQYTPASSNIGYWVRFFGLRKKNKAIKDFQVVQQKCKQELPDVTACLYQYQDILIQMNQMIYGPQTYQYAVGEICHGMVQSDETLKWLAMGLLDTVPLQGLTQSIEINYPNLDVNNKMHGLKLIHQLLLLDKHGHLVDCDGEPSVLKPCLDALQNASTDEALKDQLTKISIALKNVTLNAQTKHQHFISELSHDNINIQHLIERLNQLKDNYNSHLVTLRHTIKFTFDVLKNLPESFLTMPDHKSLIDQVQSFVSLIPVREHMRLRMLLEQILEDTVHQKIYDIPEWARPTLEPRDKMIYFSEKEKVFNFNIEQIAQGKMVTKQQQNIQWEICQMIRNHAIELFSKIELDDLKRACWDKNLITRIENHTLANRFPNLNQLIEFETMITHWVCDCILYTFSDDKHPRLNISQMARLREFFSGIISLAIQKGYHQVAYFISQGLHHPSLNDFESIAPALSHAVPKHLPIEQLSYNQLPHFSKLATRLQKLHSLCKGTFAYMVMGKIFHKLDKIQTELQHEKSEGAFIGSYVNKRINWRILKGSEVVVNFREIVERDNIYKELCKASFISKYTLKNLDFDGIYQRCQLALKYNTQLNIVKDVYQKPESNPYKAIIKQLNKLIQKKDILPSISLILNVIVDLAMLCPQTPNHEIDADVSQLLSLWERKIEKLIASDALPQRIIEAIQLDLKEDELLVANKLNTSTGYKKTQSILSAIKLNSHEWFDIEPMPEYSQAYIKTLNSYLEGTEQQQIKLPSRHDSQTFQTNQGELTFQDVEEESDPDVIGFAETWNIFKQISNNEIQGPPFSYENLKDTFFKAFPWAIDDQAKLFRQPVIDNLLLVNPTVAKRLQKSVMSLVFISLDTIGKLAGPYGEFVLYNLEKIDHIISMLETVTEVLDDPSFLLDEENALEFEQLMDAKICGMQEQNQRLYNKLTEAVPINTHEKYAKNPYVNYLMSVNEQEIYYHIDSQTESIESILPPPIHEDENHAPITGQSYTEDTSKQEMDEWEELTQEINGLFDEDIFV